MFVTVNPAKKRRERVFLSLNLLYDYHGSAVSAFVLGLLLYYRRPSEKEVREFVASSVYYHGIAVLAFELGLATSLYSFVFRLASPAFLGGETPRVPS